MMEGREKGGEGVRREIVGDKEGGRGGGKTPKKWGRNRDGGGITWETKTHLEERKRRGVDQQITG